MTLPRAVYPGSATMLTRRCTQRQFLLRPDPEINNAFIYCLAVAANRHSITVMNFVQMPNHKHEAVYDRRGVGPEFYRDFHALLAKCVNAFRGRWENVFAGGQQTNVVYLETQEALIHELVYIATNPVKAGLVERVADWPGAAGYKALVEGRVLRATRPSRFFADDGDMPEEVTLELTIPPELGDRDTIVAEVKARVAAFEAEEARRRAETGRRVRGRYGVLRQSWRDSPASREPRRGLRPTVAARDLCARLEALQRRSNFLADYRHARRALLGGTPIPFPHGTYLLRRTAGVQVLGPEKQS